jgi:hypothetical protein
MSRMQEIMEKRGPYEELDPTPLEIPENAKKPLTMKQEMERFFKSEQLKKELEAAGWDTEEEANDFEIPEGDDLDFGITEAEMIVMAEEFPVEPLEEGVEPEEDLQDESEGEDSSMPNQEAADTAEGEDSTLT